MGDDQEPSLQANLSFAIAAWYGDRPIDVEEVLNSLVGITAEVAVKAGCNTPERRNVMADHLRANVLSALEHFGQSR